MSMLDYLKSIVGVYPTTPNEFVKKYIKDSKKSRVQLEMIYRKEIILQIDSLKFVPSWFKIVNIDSQSYKDGHVIFFIIDKEGFQENANYKNYQQSGLEMIEIEEMHNKTEIVTFAKFINTDIDFMDLAGHMREIINGVYHFKEQNPQILFNLRYLD